MRPDKGFTLVEALAAIVLITVGMVATLKCVGAMVRAQGRAFDKESMQRLALAKYDEIVAQGTLTTGQSQGDFSELGQPRLVWRAQRTSTGIDNLDTIVVEVTDRSEGFDHGTKLQGLLCSGAKAAGGKK